MDQLLIPSVILDGNGDPVSGALVDVFNLDTATRATIYADDAASAQLPNPVVCDAFGVPPQVFYQGTAQLEATVKTAAGVTIRTYDPVGLVRSDTATIYKTSNILGTVSQAAGVPTGAVIQAGSNANGRFTRFADGTQICTHELSSSASAAVTWTFPSVFTQVASVQASPLSGSPRFVSVPTKSLTAATVSAWDASSTRIETSVALSAIGRWF